MSADTETSSAAASVAATTAGEAMTAASLLFAISPRHRNIVSGGNSSSDGRGGKDGSKSNDDGRALKNPTIIFLISPFLSTRDLVQLGRTCIEFGSAQETEDQQISLINRVADHLFLNKANYNEMRALPCNISQSYILRLHRLMSMRQFLQEVAPQRGAIHFDHTHWG